MKLMIFMTDYVTLYILFFFLRRGHWLVTMKTKEFFETTMRYYDKVLLLGLNIHRVVKKSLWCDLEEKGLRNSEMFFDGVFLSIYSHFLKKLELSKLCIKKLWWSKNPENGLLFLASLKIKDFFLFLKLTTGKIFDYN